MRQILFGFCLLATACGGASGDPDSSAMNGADGAGDTSTNGNPRDATSGADASIDAPPSSDTGNRVDVQSGSDTGTGIDASRDTSAVDVVRPDVGFFEAAVDVPMTDVRPGTDVVMSGGVVDYTARGYYQRSGTTAMYVAGIPTGYVALPAGMTRTELAQLQQDCVDRINQYRAGTLRFTNGTADPGVPRTALNHLMGNNVCSTAQALGDLRVNNGAGGCAGAHTNAFSCPRGGAVAQNTCCMRNATNAAAVRSQLYGCLQQMWDEGVGMADNAAYSSANGHWHSMRNSGFTQVSCGFAFDTNGHVWMNQDFSASRPTTVPQTCS